MPKMSKPVFLNLRKGNWAREARLQDCYTRWWAGGWSLPRGRQKEQRIAARLHHGPLGEPELEGITNR